MNTENYLQSQPLVSLQLWLFLPHVAQYLAHLFKLASHLRLHGLLIVSLFELGD